jgi:hypothetical protein
VSSKIGPNPPLANARAQAGKEVFTAWADLQRGLYRDLPRSLRHASRLNRAVLRGKR